MLSESAGIPCAWREAYVPGFACRASEGDPEAGLFMRRAANGLEWLRTILARVRAVSARARMPVGRGRTLRWWVILAYGVLGLVILFVLNWSYQVARKPAELLAVLSAPLSKSPRSTWQSYAEAFREHSTAVITAEFLAALAQVESQGNPLVGTYWRWKWSWNLLDVYRPASSAVGMFQITDGTFEEMRRYCIHDHTVAERGSWFDPDACWFTALYSRLVPDHAIEMTAAYLHQAVERLLAKHGRNGVRGEDKRRLAAIVHLCGMRRGAAFVRRGFNVKPGERCGSHSVRRHLARMHALEHEFARLSAE
jgi:hypothetical protein